MPIKTLSRQAPAKLNLFLHINGRREDGYHLLQSIFARIDWYDILHFELSQDGEIMRRDIGFTNDTPLPHIDLTVRAAQALQKFAGVTSGVRIQLEKNIPSEAGMGGGSSDAAATLLALNELWQTGLSVKELAQIGLHLGADVPFFLCERHAWVEGIGEKITPIDLPASLQNARFLVIKPPRGVSTPAVFGSPDLERGTKTATIERFAAWTESNAAQQHLELFGRNDLQPVALKICPDIAVALDWFQNQGLIGRMTGSGSAVFAQIPDFYDIDAAPSLPAGWLFKLCRLI